MKVRIFILILIFVLYILKTIPDFSDKNVRVQQKSLYFGMINSNKCLLSFSKMVTKWCLFSAELVLTATRIVPGQREKIKWMWGVGDK